MPPVLRPLSPSRTLEEFLHDYTVSALSELLVLHDLPDGAQGFFAGLGDDDALAQREAVCLDHDGDGAVFGVFQSFLSAIKDLVARRWDAVLFHELLGKDLGAFDYRGLGLGPEARDSYGVQPVDAAQHEGIVRSHDGVVYALVRGEGADPVEVGGLDGHADRVARYPAVSWQGVYSLGKGIFPELFDDGVLSSAAANYEYLQICLLYG